MVGSAHPSLATGPSSPHSHRIEGDPPETRSQSSGPGCGPGLGVRVWVSMSEGHTSLPVPAPGPVPAPSHQPPESRCPNLSGEAGGPRGRGWEPVPPPPPPGGICAPLGPSICLLRRFRLPSWPPLPAAETLPCLQGPALPSTRFTSPSDPGMGLVPLPL